MGATLVFYY